MGGHGVVIVIFIFSTCAWRVSTRQNPGQNEEVGKMRQDVINRFKTDLHHFLESERIRKKRETGLLGTLTDENKFLTSHIKVASSTPEVLPFLDNHNLTFWIPIRHRDMTQIFVGTRNGDLVLFEFEGKIANMVAQSLGEFIGYKAEAFSYFDEQWFVVLQSTPEETRIRLYQRIGRGLERRQTISLDGEADFDLATVKGVHYLAVTTFFAKTNEGYTYQANVALYHWTRTQFDVVATGVTLGSRSLTCWVLDGSLYLSVAQALNDAEDSNIGSPVFLFNAKEESNLVLLETLSTKSPRKCLHFSVGGSHYLIFIGQFEASIYWWAGNQFLELQQIVGTAGASDVSILDLPNKEIAIVISLKADILFLTLDTTGYYVVTFTMNFPGRTISSTQFIFDGENYLALILFEEAKVDVPYVIYKLSLGDLYLPNKTVDPLLQCLSRLTSSLSERKTKFQEFETNADKIWLSNESQIITAPVVINGSVVVKDRPLITDTVMISVKQQIPPLPTAEDLQNKFTDLSQRQVDAEKQLGNVVLKSADQEIKGNKDLQGTVRLKHLALRHLTSDAYLNGISVSALIHNTLKNSGNQTFRGSLYAREVSVETILTHKLNDVDVGDFLLLRGNQSVTGDLTFANVRGTDIAMSPFGMLNGVPLGRYVTSNSDQIVEGLKTFQLLKSEVVDVHGTTNGEDLSELWKNAITTDGAHDIFGSLEMQEPLIVTGDIFINGLINHVINISKLGKEAVDKHSDQIITGSKAFSSLYVLGNLDIEGRINGIDLDRDVLTGSTDQEVRGDVTFLSPVTFEKDLQTDLLNGIDLENRCVVLRGNVPILGHKTFKSKVTANDVKLDDGVTLDGVDPSELASMAIQHDRGIVTDNVVLGGVLVLGNLEADQGINDIKVDDLPNLVYMKSAPQTVTTPVFFRGSITMDGALEATLINNLDLAKDVVHAHGDEEVLSNKIFKDIIVQNDLMLGPGTLLNGADLSSFTHMENISGTAIHGRKTFMSLEVYGDIINFGDSGFLQNVMIAERAQTVTGQVWPSSMTISGDLIVSDIIPTRVNGMDFQYFLSNAVMKDRPEERQITRKIFADLRASSLSFSEKSRIDGVLIPEMILSAVFLDSRQSIQGEKTFTGPVEFQNAITAGEVNGVDLANLHSRVVFTNRNEIIRGRKTILGNVEANNVVVQGLINGVNVTSLASNAIYKSRANEFSAHVTFLNDVDIGSLFVGENSLIDGLSLGDVARTDKDQYLANVTFLSDIRMARNATVSGLVNGCDLHEVLSKALLTSSTDQVFDAEFEIDSLKVIGNVSLKGTINGVQVEDVFRPIVQDGDQVLYGNFHVDSTLGARNLMLRGTVQGMDLNYLMQDAVRKSIPQVIRGYTFFNEDVEIGVLQLQRNLLVLGDVNRVDFNKMIQETVWKKEFQVIYGTKTLHRIYANDILVQGYLNHLKIPQDVILANTTEVIPGQVFMKDLVLNSNLFVGGRIDGVDMEDFLNRRVTLMDDEILAGSVIFEDEIFTKGDMTVEGLINDVSLRMVVKTNQDSPINGRKTFAGDLFVKESLTSSLINYMDLEELSRSVVRINKDEILQVPVVFTNRLYVLNSTVVDVVNGVSVSSLKESFKNQKNIILENEMFLETSVKNTERDLELQAKYIPYQISVYAYFIKVQELDIGPSNRIQISNEFIIPGEFRETMLMWVSHPTCESPGRCCDISYTYFLHADDNGHVTVMRGPEDGRYFQLTESKHSSSAGNSYIWTNTTLQPSWCRSPDFENTQVVFFERDGDRNLVVADSPLLTDVKSFRDYHLYVVVAFYSDKNYVSYTKSAVYRYHEESSKWEEHQLLETSGIVSMDIITPSYNDSDILLAVGTGNASYPGSAVVVYKWNKNVKKFEATKSFHSAYVTSLIWIDQGKDNLSLAAASVNQLPYSEECSKILPGGEINVYHRKGHDYRWIQSIDLPAIVSMVSFSISGDTFLAAAGHQTETIHILRWQGYSKFSVIQTIFSRGVRHLNVFSRRNDLYMTVASSSGSSHVLKAIVRGQSSWLQEDNYDDDHELSDAEIPAEYDEAPRC